MIGAFDISRSGPILVVRWNSVPSDADFAELRTIVTTARNVAGEPLVYVTIVPEAFAVQSALSAQVGLVRHLKEASPHCRSSEIVVEGSSAGRKTAEQTFVALIAGAPTIRLGSSH